MSSVGLIRARRRCDVVPSCAWARGVSAPNSRFEKGRVGARVARVRVVAGARACVCGGGGGGGGAGGRPGNFEPPPRNPEFRSLPFARFVPTRETRNSESGFLCLKHYSSRGGPSLAAFDLGK